MPGLRRLLLLPRGPRAALPELRRRRAHRQRLRLGAPPLPPHRRPGRPGAGRPRPGAAGAAASPAGEERPGPAALRRERLQLGGRCHREPRGLVGRERAVRLPCSASRRGGEPGHAEAEPAGAGFRCRPGPRRRRGHGLAPGRVLPRRQRLQRRLQLRRERHLQGRQREARGQHGGLPVLPLVVGGPGRQRAVRPGAGDPVVGAGAPLPADGLRPPLATRRRPRQHGLRAGHLVPGQLRPLLPDRRRSSRKAPEESLARDHHAHDCS